MLWILCLVMVAACHKEGGDPGMPPPDGDCDGGIEIVEPAPFELSVHGGDVIVGTVEEFSAYLVSPNGEHSDPLSVPERTDGYSTIRVFPYVTLGAAHDTPLRIDFFRTGPSGQPKRFASVCGRFVETPARGVISRANDFQTLDVPLHPELDAPCARFGKFVARNTGDMPFVVSPIASGSSAFTTDLGNCTTSLAYNNFCTFTACFTSSTPGTHTATITAAGAEGEVLANATVLPFVPGLDTSFGGDGAVIVPHKRAWPAVPASDGTSVLSYGVSLTFDRHDASGARTAVTIAGVEAHGMSTVEIRAMRATANATYAALAATGGGLAALVKLDANLARDMTFANGAGVVDIPASCSATRAIWVQPSGRVLVVASNCVVAFTAGGVVDTTYGANGVVPTVDTIASAMDASGSLYIAKSSSVSRLLVDGGSDASFSHTGPVTAIASSDSLLVGGGGFVKKLDATGATVISYNVPGTIRSIDVDRDGRIYAAPDSTVIRLGSVFPFPRLDLGSAGGVACSPAGGCWIAGGASSNQDYIARLAP